VTDAGALGRSALDWLVKQELADDSPWLYNGRAGVVLGLLEGHLALGEDRYAAAALDGARALASAVDEVPGFGLYFGLTGVAFALHKVGEALNDPAATVASRRALDLVRAAFDGERWGDAFELLGGNAGIALGALHLGDADLAVLAAEPYLRRAEPTAAGVTWQHRAGAASRLHHISHGTLGISYALAAVGHALDRPDFVEAGLSGAADVVSRNEAGPEGFLVRHSDPQWKPSQIEPYSYGWCHGPAGDAQVFRLLTAVTGDESWTALIARCWHTVTHSGVPQRLRPGFWDNSGRCCGTAGVLALACDLGDVEFGQVLVADLRARARSTAGGACWSNFEHRVTPSDLPPEPGWAMGNAGIARELLRYDRLVTAGDPDYFVGWPDQLPLPG
jgi:lantibiotic modifying enzyme